MSKLKAAIAAISVLSTPLALSSPVQAHHSYTFVGKLNMFKGIRLNCTVTVVKTPSHTTPGTGTVTVNISAPDALCPALVVTSNPSTYDQSGSDLTINDVYVQTITAGDCEGDITGTKHYIGPGVDPALPGGGWVIDVDSFLPGGLGSPDCTVEGRLYS